MSKITIIEGNTNDKDDEKIFFLKGEKGADGLSPSASVSKDGNITTLSVTDAEGTTEAGINDGISPTVSISKSGGVTTITITDADGPHTATVNDGEISQAELNAALDNYYNKTDSDARYPLKADIAVATTTITMADGEGSGTASYPTGFNKDNCIVLSFMCNNTVNASYSYGYIEDSASFVAGIVGHKVTLGNNSISVKINVPFGDHTQGVGTFDCKVVLMKVS